MSVFIYADIYKPIRFSKSTGFWIKIIYFFSSLLLSINLSAQTNFQVSGKVIDHSINTPIDFATITFFNLSDTSFFKGTVTDENGIFKFERIASGDYLLKIEHLSYEEQVLPVEINESHSFPPFLLKAKANQLQEVEVKGRKLTMQQDLNKITVNVEQSIIADGGTAVEILKQVPIVMINPDGTVSIRGDRDIQILIDGKPSGLAAIQGTRFLEQIDASMIAKIEIITNPSAKYDANGSAGVINLIMTKPKGSGRRGKLKTSIDQVGEGSVGLDLSFRKQRVNTLLNYQIRRQYRVTQMENTRWQMIDGEINTINQKGHSRFLAWRQSLEMGLDYYLSERTYLTIAGIYQSRTKENEQNIFSIEENDLQEVINTTSSIEEPEENKSYGFELALTSKRKTKQKWNMLLSFIHSSESEQLKRNDEVYHLNSLDYLDFNSEYLDLNDRWLMDFSYEIPLQENVHLESGARFVYRKIEQDFSASEASWNDHFLYEDYIASAYSIFSIKKKKWKGEFGLRFERAQNDFQSFSLSSSFGNTFYQFFPSLNWQYTFDDFHKLSFSYSKRVNRPSPNRLNPFPDFSTPFAIKQGNPNLNPVIIHALEAGFSRNWEKMSVNILAFFKNFQGAIERIQTVQENGLLLTAPVNLRDVLNYGFDLSIHLSPASWLDMQMGGSIFQNAFLGQQIEDQFRAAFTIKWSNNIQFGKGFEGQLLYSYVSSINTPQGIQSEQYYLDLGLSYHFPNYPIKIALIAMDGFNILKERQQIGLPDLAINNFSKRNTQRLRLALSWKF